MCLAACSGSEPYEAVVIDNGSEPPLPVTALDVPGLPASRLLHEPRSGKSHALNRAIDEGALGEIVAVLDDDMSPAEGWIEGVLASARRLPEFEIFSGRSHVIWPPGVDVPPWAHAPLAQGLLFSVFDLGPVGDVEFGIGCPRFPSGGHFWFRRSLLGEGVRFPPVWTTEPYFVVALEERGHRGVFVPEVVVGHRIQPGLVDKKLFQERASRFGRDMARMEICSPRPPLLGAAAWIRPWKRRVRALTGLVAWSLYWLWAGLWTEGRRLPALARALWGLALTRERLRQSW